MPESSPATPPSEDKQKESVAWERKTLERLAFSAMKEQRRTRRWGIFFKFLFTAYLFILLLLYFPGQIEVPGMAARHTALVEVTGIISADTFASAENITKGLQAAFENEHTAGVILRINSPGGSPVQAGYINDEIRRLRQEHPKVPVYAVITDVCASGGYYIAVAADQIYADKASIVGSIGVVLNSFGFVDAMEKLGIERRLFTAGDHKFFLDPFSPVEEFEKQHIQDMLETIHKQFIEVVKEGRGDRLKASPTLFSGLIWTGEEALGLGLVDGLGSSDYVAREIIKAETIVDYTPQPPLLERFTGRLGTALTNMLSEIALKL